MFSLQKSDFINVNTKEQFYVQFSNEPVNKHNNAAIIYSINCFCRLITLYDIIV